MILHSREILRYVFNGFIATAVHLTVLTFNLQVLGFNSAGVANFVAALCGITISFLGSRYFVFTKIGNNLVSEALKFGSLYSLIAFFHGLGLYVWTDRLSLDYRIGFLIMTVLQVSLTYFCNKFLVFKS